MILKRNINFWLDSRKKDGVPVTENLVIRMRLSYGGKAFDYSTGYRIDASKWDVKKQRVKNGCTNKRKETSIQINTELNRLENLLQDIFREFEYAEQKPTMDNIKTVFKQQISDVASTASNEPSQETIPEKTFWDIYDEFVKECGRKNDWTHSTFEKFAAFKNHLLAFKKFAKNPSFDFFTEKGLNDLVDFFRKDCDMLNSTIGKQMGYLKWFLKWAAAKGYHMVMDYNTFKPKLKNTQAKVIFLTDEEVKKIMNFEIPETKKYLERVRDVLIFCCYTGLRYSDVENLRRSDIKEDHIEITTVKTADSLVIELNKHSKAILDKYKDVAFEGNRALPVISNQKMNKNIKELGRLAEIDTPIRITQYRGNERIDNVYPKYELLCTHTGRKTFICKALSLGIAPNVVMKWTGHSDYKAMKPYIDIADSVRANAMSLFD